MSAEHKRPLYAFVVLTLLCGVLLGKAMRTDALPGLLLGPAGSVIAAQALLDDVIHPGQHDSVLDDGVVLAAGKRFQAAFGTGGDARAIERKAIERPGARAIERKAIERPGARAIERKAIERPGARAIERKAIERPGARAIERKAIERSSERSVHHRPALRRTPPAHAKRPAQHPGKGHAKGHTKGKAKGKARGHRR